MSPGEVVIAYHRGLGDEAANKEFHSSKLGLPFMGEGAQVTDEMIEACIRDHTTTTHGRQIGGNRLITMGVDQGKTGYISVVEWLFERHLGTDINAAAIGKLLWFGKFSGEETGIISAN